GVRGNPMDGGMRGMKAAIAYGGFLLWLLASTVLAAPAPVGQTLDLSAGDRRIALVIGNSAYRVGPLKNPVNDARAMATALRDLGFEVLLREDAGMATMIDAIREFSRKAAGSQV